MVAKRFIRSLKNKIYKYMTSILKNVYTDNTNHRTIKMKLIDVKPSIYIDFNKENNKEGSEFTVGDYVRTSKYKTIFAKGYVPN